MSTHNYPSNYAGSTAISDHFFSLAVTGTLKSNLKNNARLDPETIAALAGGIIAPKPTITTTDVSASPDYFDVCYELGGALTIPNKVLVRIVIYTDAYAAQTTMRKHLEMFDQDIREVVTKPDRAIGQVALRTAGSIFWVRDSVWVWVMSMSSCTPLSYSTAPPTRLATNVNLGFSSTSQIQDVVLTGFAEALDGHLAACAVRPSLQLKPKTAVRKNFYKVPCGEIFNVWLVDPLGTHELKLANAIPDIIFQICNGTAAGKYTFLGGESGKARLQLIIARADTLAVETVDVYVEVT